MLMALTVSFWHLAFEHEEKKDAAGARKHETATTQAWPALSGSAVSAIIIGLFFLLIKSTENNPSSILRHLHAFLGTSKTAAENTYKQMHNIIMMFLVLTQAASQSLVLGSREGHAEQCADATNPDKCEAEREEFDKCEFMEQVPTCITLQGSKASNFAGQIIPGVF